jgi:hypothetical protein
VAACYGDEVTRISPTERAMAQLLAEKGKGGTITRPSLRDKLHEVVPSRPVMRGEHRRNLLLNRRMEGIVTSGFTSAGSLVSRQAKVVLRTWERKGWVRFDEFQVTVVDPDAILAHYNEHKDCR